MKEFVFNEENRSTEIDLEQLQATMAIGEFDGKMPASVPMTHFEFVNEVMGIGSSTGIDVALSPITVRERYCKKKRGATDNSPENYQINRLAAKLHFADPMFPDEPHESRPGIAFTYVYDSSLRGIQVAFGPSVNACDNLTVFGKNRFSTNGNDKVPFDQGMELLKGWMQNYQKIRAGYEKRITQMRSLIVTPDQVHMLVGKLYTGAVRANMMHRDITAPLNMTEVGAMIRHGFDVRTLSGEITAWDVLNWGTQVLKPADSDMTSLISNTVIFNDFIYAELFPEKEKQMELEHAQ